MWVRCVWQVGAMWVRESKAKQLVKEDEWVWGQHAYRIEVWGIWGREGACEIKWKCFLCIQQVCRLRSVNEGTSWYAITH